MKAVRIRLVVAAVLFLAWIGWLAYLVLSMDGARPVVLSRPQFLVSTLDVIAEVDDIDRDAVQVKIRKVHWPRNEATQEMENKQQEITVTHLSNCKKDWIGPGQYVLPLVEAGPGVYEVARIPRSPGFPDAGQPRIYPASQSTEAQLQAIPKL